MCPTKEIVSPKENPSPARVSFIYYYHDEREYPDSDPLFGLLHDQDLIFTENVGLSLLDRSRLEDELNLVLGNTNYLSSAQINQRNQLLERFRGSPDIDEQIALHFAGTDKTLVFVDISADDTEAYVVFQKSCRLRESINQALLTGDLTQAKNYHIAYINNLAAEVALRDRIVAGQIHDYLDNQSRGCPRAAVLQGYLHAQTSNLFRNHSPECLIDVHCFSPFFTPEITLVESILRGLPVTQQDFDRALLSDYILISAIANETNNDERQSLTILSELINSITDNQVSVALAQFPIILRQTLAQLTNRRTKDRQNYLPFAYAQTAACLLRMVRHWLKK